MIAPEPPVQLTLPDGQVVQARLTAKRWTPTGWLYEVRWPIWAATGGGEVEPRDYTVWVPAGQGEDQQYVRPLPGIDYDGVPTDGPPSHPYLAPAPPGADMSWAWTVEQVRAGGPGTRATGIVVHEWGCAAAPPGGPELDLDEALTVVARPETRLCKECAAAEVLSRL
ncbi:DUF6233 domain-containing protein (plasmid) [Streptomyces sp. NBC_01278]|uniref:DUF6233 domain-containing protein n=1 Tax=Streptomyces sp. NBC_01278 TaxID=2903809 RepID=UPI002E3307F0|nr:DUF6233 domain-containing protein [Streptomyces sp. NBC_01278]